MNHGERQVSPTIDGIRKDHVDRYKFVAERISRGDRVIDFACGIGYGARIMATAGAAVHGFDVDPEAIEYAKRHYIWHNTEFAVADGREPGDIGEYDAAVCFETIEHIEDPRPLLRALRAASPVLYCSVPNEDVMPFSPEPGMVTAYHFRHYTRPQFEALLAECGWGVDEWHGQEGPESSVQPDVRGRTLVAVCRRAESARQAALFDDGSVAGKSVAILGLGPSLNQFAEIAKRHGGRHVDEVWGINAVGNVFNCDRVFHMDDVRVQELRAAAKPEGNIAAMLRWMKRHPGPIYTSREHEAYPGLVEFPLAEVVNEFGQAYFNSTAAYAVAFAVFLGVKRIEVYGFDFTYPNAHHAEKGRACVEFWLGIAVSKGIDVKVPHVSTLLDACEPEGRLYGYDTLDVAFSRSEAGAVMAAFTPKEAPSADEVEARYDHNKHPNAIVEKEGTQCLT